MANRLIPVALLLTASAALLAPPASAGGADVQVQLLLYPISECVWYLPSVAGGVGYCYNYETGTLCVNDPTPVTVCVELDEIPFLDEDELMATVWCIRSDPANAANCV